VLLELQSYIGHFSKLKYNKEIIVLQLRYLHIIVLPVVLSDVVGNTVTTLSGMINVLYLSDVSLDNNDNEHVNT